MRFSEPDSSVGEFRNKILASDWTPAGSVFDHAPPSVLRHHRDLDGSAKRDIHCSRLVLQHIK